jgi:hypothetical protein
MNSLPLTIARSSRHNQGILRFIEEEKPTIVTRRHPQPNRGDVDAAIR